MSVPDPPRRALLGVEVEVLLLGLVSFLTDVSSELVFSVLPLFLTSVLGVSALALGVMEGLADFAASSLDLASGYLSDRTGERKRLAALGYGLSAAAKGFLLLAATAAPVMIFRVVERLGKSIRGAPRDALLASIASGEKRGVSFGVHKALDRAGAVLGPLVAWAVLGRLGVHLETFRTLFAIAFVPAVLGVLVLVATVRDRRTGAKQRLPLRAALASLGRPYRGYLLSASIFALGYFSFAFLLLHAARAGFSLEEVPLLYALFNVTFTIVSIPLGRLGDRVGRRLLIGLGYVAYGLVLAAALLAPGRAGAVLVFVLYGVFYAIDEGQSKAYLADLTEPAHRATAIGAYNFVTGLVYLPASLFAGLLWERVGPGATFGFAAGVTAVASLAFVLAPGPERTRDEVAKAGGS